MKAPVVIAITMGDPAGIGPEVVAKALTDRSVRDQAAFVYCGRQAALLPFMGSSATDALQTARELPSAPEAGRVFVFEPEGSRRMSIQPAVASPAAGLQAGKSLELAVTLLKTGKAHALVTAPICKESFNLAGYHFQGHTEFLASRFHTEDVVMMLVSGDFRVALATTHMAIADVPGEITVENIVRKVRIIHADLQQRFGIVHPRIAVLGLNPHAGENGLFGQEEITAIAPAIARLRGQGVDVAGPFSADTVFARRSEATFDLYFAMYHDQGLIPLKMASFGKAVNYTAGLPVIRTSPDHGTAFDIAGSGSANADSMKEAIRLAVQLVSNVRDG